MDYYGSGTIGVRLSYYWYLGVRVMNTKIVSLNFMLHRQLLAELAFRKSFVTRLNVHSTLVVTNCTFPKPFQC